jgi:flagellar biosynthetic protein FliR
MELALSLGWLEPVMLAGVRMVSFLVIAPPFSYNAFPARIKAMLALGLAFAVSPVVTAGYQERDTAAFFGALVLEIGAGVLMGFLVYLVFAAVQSAGSLIDLMSGFQMAQAFDPQSMINGAQFTRLFQMTAVTLMFSSDAYQLILGGLVRSFSAIPLGGGVALANPAEAIVTAATGMFLSAVQIAGPLLVIFFLADVGLGLLNRVAPALNAFALGFPLKVLLALSLGSVVLLALPRVVSALTQEALTLLGGLG